MSRRDARDIGFKLVFSYSFDKEENNEVLEEYLASVDADDGAYIREVYKVVTSHYDELVEEVSKHADKFEIDRIYKVDLAILLLAVYEIKYMEQVPFKVSVDEAVNLAHKYSTEKSGKFINGILSKFVR